MRIEINTAEVINNVKDKSRRDCEALDVDTRYRYEVGTEKMDEVKRIMTQVQARFKRFVTNYLVRAWQTEASNEIGMPEYFIYDLLFSDRRAANKMQELADLAHEYFVAYTLAKYYGGVGAQELSNTYSLLVAEAARELDELINTKTAP